MSVVRPAFLPDFSGVEQMRLEGVTEVGVRLGVGAILVSERATLRWLGLRDTRGTHALISGRSAVLLLPADRPADAQPPSDLPIESYDAGAAEGLAASLSRAFVGVGLDPDDALGIEPSSLPFCAGAAFQSRPWVDGRRALAEARMRKTADEVDLITSAVELADTGHATARAAGWAGASELELWGAAQRAMQNLHGGPVEANVDLMSGARCELVGAPPTAGLIRDGAPILFDLAPSVDGYWADSAATFAAGPVGARLARVHDAVRSALEAGIECTRPGVAAAHVDASIRARLQLAGLRCPHHTGHGVGAAAQEDPWLTPDSDAAIGEGMVIALEPGAYGCGVGVRLEQLLVVESSGARVLSNHSLSLHD